MDNILNYLPDGIVVSDLKGCITAISPKASEMFGYMDPSECIGEKIIDFLVPEDRPHAQEMFALRINGDNPGLNEYYALRKDGTSFPIEVRGSLVPEVSFESARVVFSIRNITDRKNIDNKFNEVSRILRLAYSAAKLGYITSDTNNPERPWEYSPSIELILGINANTIMNLNIWLQSVHPDDQERVKSKALSFYNNHSPFFEEYRIIRANDGQVRWISVWADKEYGKDGNLLHNIAIIQDITDRKVQQIAYRDLFLKNSEIMLIIDPTSGKIIDANNAASIFYGYSINELTGMHISNINTLASDEISIAMESITERSGSRFHFVHRLASGELRQVEVASTKIQSAEGTVLHSIIYDITDRIKAEQELKFSKIYNESLIKAIPDLLFVNRLDGEYLDYHAPNQNLLLLPPSEFLNRKVVDIFPPDLAAPFMQAIKSAITTQSIQTSNFSLTLHGIERFFEARVSPIGDDQVVTFVRDTTDLRNAENSLRIITAAVEQSSASVVITDIDGNIQFANPAFTKATGYSLAEAIGQNPRILKSGEMSSENYRELWEAISSGRNWTGEFHNKRKDGSLFWERATISPIRDNSNRIYSYVAVKEDITEEKSTKEKLIELNAHIAQMQKMESLGSLAGGIAHDMNNVLGAILGVASAHIVAQPYGSPLHKAFDTICKATERGGKMVRSLLNFARKGPVETVQINLNGIIKEQLELLERTTLSKVRIRMNLEPELRSMVGDPNSLAHALMNLCVNAVDSMPEAGTLTLKTSNVDDEWLEVVVEDTGTGMSKEVMDRALEPFYTTKGVGKGTGLGLSMVFSTVQAHQGQLHIQSNPGKGTRVILMFPARDLKGTTIESTGWVGSMASVEGKKVLLVDDDDLVQSSVSLILETIGYTNVTIAKSGEEALKILKAGFDPDFIILDMNMPGLGGAGTLPQLRSMCPVVPILLSTGRTDQTALTLAASHPGVTILPKPFGLRELQKQLESIGLS